MSCSISIRGLTKTFPAPGGGTSVAVAGVDLAIERGELFFLLGPSGCGKTTLLRMIAGFIDPTSGSIRFDQRDVTHLPPNKRNTGMVFQSYALWPHMTVEANVAFGLTIRKVPAEERRRRVSQALDAVRMGEYAARKPNQLSGGQQQRVALARALVVRPDVLLLDEPLSNLDAKLRIELRSEIRRICKEAGEDGHGITTVYVTHDQKEALSMADRVAIMRSGHVMQLGSPAELYRRPNSRFVAEFLGETNIFDASVAESTAADGTLRLTTDAGALSAINPSGNPFSPGARALLSIRPEALRVHHAQPASTAPNTLKGVITESTYLGEIAQHLVQLAPGICFKVAELNPAQVAPGANGQPVWLSVATDDVVVVPPEVPTSA